MASAPPPPPPKRLVGTTTPTPSRDAPPPPPPPRQRPVGVVAETLNPQGIAVTRTIPVATSSTTGAANHHNQHHHPQQANGGVVPLQRHTSSSSNAALGTNGVGGPPPPIRKSLVQQPIVQQQMGSSPGGAGMVPPPRTSGAAMNVMPPSNGAPPPPPPPPPQRGVAISSATGAAIPPPPPQRIQSVNLPPPPPQQRMSAGGTHPGVTPHNAHGAAPPPPPRSPQQQQPPGLSPTLVLATIASLEKESRRNILKAEQETLELLWELHHSAQSAVLALSSSTGHLRASNEQSAKLRRIERREQRLGRPQLLFRPKTSVSVAKQQQQHGSSSSGLLGTSSSATSNHVGSSPHGHLQPNDPALLCLKVADVRFLCNKIRNEVELHLVETVQSGTAAAGGETAATTADDDAVDGGEESDEVVCLRKVRPRLQELTQSLHHLINCVTVPHSSSSESNVLVPPVSYAPCESSLSGPGNEVGGVPTAGGGSGGGQFSKLAALPTSTHTAAAMSGQCLVSDEQFAFFVDAFWNWSEALDEKKDKDVTGPGQEADEQPSSPRATTNAAAPTHPSAFQQLCALPGLSGRYFAAVPQCTEWFQAQELTCAFYLAVLQRFYLGSFSQLTPIVTPNAAAGFGVASACASSKKEKKLVLPPLGLLNAAMESCKTMSLPLHVDVVQLVLAMTTQYHQQPAHLLPLHQQGGKVGDSKRGILDGGALSSQHPSASSKNNNNSKAGGGGGASRKKRYQEARGGGREATHEQGALPEKIPDRNEATSALAVVWEPLFLSRRYLALVPTILASSSSSQLSTGGRYCMLVADKAGFCLSLDGPNVDRHASNNSHASSPASAVSKKQITPLLGFTGADANVMATDGPVSMLCHQDQPGGGCGGSSSLLRTVNHFFELQLSGLRSSVWHHSVFYEANQIQAMLIFATDFALACLEQLTGSALGGEQQEAETDPKMALADASAAALALLHHLLMTYYQLAAQEQNKRQPQEGETGGGSSIEEHLPLKGMMSWGRLLTALTPVHTWGTTDHEQDINPGGVRGTDPTARVTERLQNHWHVALGDLLQYFQVWM